jgi:hypothetical protein
VRTRPGLQLAHRSRHTVRTLQTPPSSLLYPTEETGVGEATSVRVCLAPLFYRRYTLATATAAVPTSFLNSLVAPYGPDSLIARLFLPHHDTSPPLPGPSTQTISVPPRTQHPHVHNGTSHHTQRATFTIYLSFLWRFWVRSAAHNDPQPWSLSLLSSSAPFAGLRLRASCLLQATCLRNPIFFSFFSFLFPADSSRSAAPKPMGVKAVGCQRPRPLVDISDSDSDPDSRPLTPC